MRNAEFGLRNVKPKKELERCGVKETGKLKSRWGDNETFQIAECGVRNVKRKIGN